MANQNNKQKPKNKKSGVVAAIVLIVIWTLSSVDWDHALWRLRRLLRRGEMSEAGAAVLIVVVAVLAIFLLVLTLTRLHKVRAAKRFDGIRSFGGGTARAHSHDQITGYRVGAEDAQEHWKKQLDGFLEAGIIDRAEYRVLLERRRSR